jgi:hypothetical protein
VIPTTVTGILLLLVLLLPGFVFVTFREQHRPTRRLSTFRETSLVLAATTVSYAVPLLLVILLAVLVEPARAELGGALVEPLHYWHLHPFRTIAMGGLIVVTGAAVSAFLGSSRSALLSGTRGGSAWWEVFEPGSKLAAGKATTQVTATLDDGSEITGVLHSWNRDGEDGPDRDFVLVDPLWIQPADQSEVRRLDAESIVISARRLRYLSARYFEITDEAPVRGEDRADSGGRLRRTGVALLAVALGSLLVRRFRGR